MSSQFYPILMNILAGVFGALGQYAYKRGSQQLGQLPIVQNYSLWMGMLLFCVVMVFFVAAYKLGGAYVYSLSFLCHHIYLGGFNWSLHRE